MFLKPYLAIQRPAVRASLRIASPNRVLPERHNVPKRFDFRAR